MPTGPDSRVAALDGLLEEAGLDAVLATKDASIAYLTGFWGLQLERFFGVAPIFHGTGLVFGVFSYRGEIDLTFVSCRRLVPDPEFLAECVRESYEELRAAAGPPPTRRGKRVREKASVNAR